MDEVRGGFKKIVLTISQLFKVCAMNEGKKIFNTEDIFLDYAAHKNVKTFSKNNFKPEFLQRSEPYDFPSSSLKFFKKFFYSRNRALRIFSLKILTESLKKASVISIISNDFGESLEKPNG